MVAYSLPNLGDLVNKISTYKVFSTINLLNLYQCIPFYPNDKIHIFFEANGRVFQLKRLSFGLTNGVVCFLKNHEQIHLPK